MHYPKHAMRLQRATLVPTALIASCFARPAGAQLEGRPPVGARVRLETPDGRRVTGRVLRIEGDTIRLRAQRQTDTSAFILGQFRSYALSAGPDRGRGLRHGVLVGGAFGVALIAVAAYADATTDADLIIPGTVLAVPAAAGLVIIGAGIGALSGPERWGPAMPLRVGVAPPVRGGAGVGLALRF